MRGNKFEKSHIHILESETLRRESRVTETLQEIVDSTPYFFANNRPMFAICQDYYRLCGEERRRIEMTMSRCFTWFPIGGLGKPKLYQNMWCFTRSGKIVEGV